MGELGALFNPGMRHELEERQSKAARREEEGNARDGDLRIDLESGVAVINIAGDDDQDGERGNGASAAAANGSATDQDATARPTGRHAAEAADDADQSAAETKPEPPALRPRGKRGMSAANR
jgi:hypothetical protein